MAILQTAVLQVLDDIVREIVEDAADVDPRFGHQIAAAGAFGVKAVFQNREDILLRPFSLLDQPEPVGDPARSGFAGGALSARFDRQEAGEVQAGFQDTGGVVVDDEAAGADPGRDLSHRCEIERGIEFIGRDHGVGRAGEDRPDMTIKLRAAAVDLD